MIPGIRSPSLCPQVDLVGEDVTGCSEVDSSRYCYELVKSQPSYEA